jgi:ubiquitin C-terminal hydrolase
MSNYCGFQNLGNTCFLNAGLQLLLSIDALPKEPTNSKLCNAYWELVDLIAQHPMPIKDVLIPRGFVQEFYQTCRNSSGFVPGHQSDAGEFVAYMLDCFHEHYSKEGLALRSITYGLLQTEYIMTDLTKTAGQKEPFNILFLPMDDVSSTSTLRSLLQTFVEFEPLLYATDDKKYIRKRVVELPPVFFICLKRFSANGAQKVNSVIDFPVNDSLDLGFLVGDVTIPYRVTGVINHMGSVHGGHYNAYIQKDNRWLVMDDAHVGLIDPRQVVSSFAYVLVLQRDKFSANKA